MKLELDDLDRQLAGLTGRFADLGAKLSDAARELQDAGAPPSDALVEELGSARTQFIELHRDVLAAAETVGVIAPSNLESVKSLEPVLRAIESALEADRRRAALEHARQGLVELLDRVLGVRHLDDDAFAPLLACHAKAETLRAAVLSLGTLEQAQDMTDAIRVFSDFLSILEGSDGLDDDRFASLQESVSNAFGRPLAVAAARGRLLLPGQEPPPPEPAPPPEYAPAPPEYAPAPPEPVLEGREALPEPLEPEVDAPGSEPVRFSAAIEIEPAPPTWEPAPEPPAPAPEPAPVAVSRGRETPSDETAQWWLAAWARWSGWKDSLSFADAVREEIGKYPYLLAVPMQQSPEFEDGLAAWGYSILIDHVEQQSPGCIGNALNTLKSGTVGAQLFDYLVTEGRLTETYAEFVKNVLLAALPDTPPWFDARIVHTKDDTRIFRRPTPRLGESEQSPRRFLADNQRFTEHKFSLTLPPMTARFLYLSAELREAHGLEAKLKVNGAPSDAGWLVTVPSAAKTSGKIEGRRFAVDGTPLPGIGRDYGAVWVAVFNADPAAEARCDLGLTLRKDVKGMRRT